MKLKLITTALISVLLSNAALFAAAPDRGPKTKRPQTDRLVNLLPASDGIAVFEAKRFLDDALPKLLSANQPVYAKVTGHISMIRDSVGIDLHKFDRVAVGVAYKTVSATETDYEPVIIASATGLNYEALTAAARSAAKNSYRTETVAGKTVSVFKIEPPAGPAPAANAPASGRTAFKGFSKEVAVTSIDPNTIAIGTLPRVKETLSGSSHLSAELVSLLSAQDAGVMAFAMRPPGGMTKLLPLQYDELGKTLNSINYIAGSLKFDTAGAAQVHLLARTKAPENALSLRDTLEVGQSLGKIAFAGKKRADQLVYARMIENVSITQRGTDVMLSISVPQSDIDVLVAGLK